MGHVQLFKCDRPGCGKLSNGDEATWWVTLDHGDHIELYALPRRAATDRTVQVDALCGMECALIVLSDWMAARTRGGREGER